MEDEFLQWYEENEIRFHQGHLDEKEIAYSAWLEGQKAGQNETPVIGREVDVYDLVTHLRHQKEWSTSAFGPAEIIDRTNGVLDHMMKEIEEARVNPKDTEEWIDIAMLAFDGAWRNGATPEEIAGTLLAKLRKNEQRQWPDWRTADPNKAIEHNGQ